MMHERTIGEDQSCCSAGGVEGKGTSVKLEGGRRREEEKMNKVREKGKKERRK